MDKEFEKEIITKIAVLETKMEMLLAETKKNNSSGMTRTDKFIIGSLITVITVLSNVIMKLIPVLGS